MKYLILGTAAFYFGFLMCCVMTAGKRAEEKQIKVPTLYPMEEYTFPTACSICKHLHDDEAESRCRECKCEVRSGFELDAVAASELDGDRSKLAIEVQVLRAKVARLMHETGQMQWFDPRTITPDPYVMCWVVWTDADGLTQVDKDAVDEDKHWMSGKPVEKWHYMPEL